MINEPSQSNDYSLWMKSSKLALEAIPIQQRQYCISVLPGVVLEAENNFFVFLPTCKNSELLARTCALKRSLSV